MRIRGWLGVLVAAAVSAGAAGCRRDRVPPQSPPTPRAEDTSNMGQAGVPDRQAIPSGNNGEGTGGSGQGSAVKELKPGERINVGVPGEKNPAEQGKPQDRR